MEQKRKTILDVAGMSCGSCVRHVDHALRELEGVADVEVRLKEGRVSVQHDAEAAPVQRLVGALANAGYTATLQT